MKHRIETSRIETPYGPFWRAWFDYLGADSSPYGTGLTEKEAIADLEEYLEELEERK